MRVLRRRLLFPLLVLLLLVPPGTAGQEAGALRIYLARHGETDWNAEGRMQGHTDTDLNETGRRQAAALGRRLEGIRLDAVYSSALRRSRETAELARGAVPLTSLPGLNERHLGKFQGQVIRRGEPLADEYDRRTKDPDDTLDEGESLNQFYERVRGALAGIREKHPSGAILIVGHGLTNRMLLRSLLDLSTEQANGIDQANDELYLIEIEGRITTLWKLIPPDRLGEL